MGKTAKKAAGKALASKPLTKRSLAKRAPVKKTAVKKVAVKRPPAKKAARPAARKAAPKSKPVPKKKAPVRKAAGGNGAPDKERFTLYGSLGSGPTYTVGLMLNLCKYPFSYIHVNLRESQHKQPDYLVKNRYGQVPSLRDGHTYYVQSAAILEHLAEQLHKFDGKTEFEKNRIREWLFWQWDKLAVPVFRLRARSRGFRQFGDEVRVLYDTEARASLALLDHELARFDWVAGKRATVADIGIYGVLRYAAEASIDLTAYPHVLEWKKRFEALPGFGTPEEILPMESRLL